MVLQWGHAPQHEDLSVASRGLPHFNVEVLRSDGVRKTAHVCLSATGSKWSIVLLMLGTCEDNLARLDAEYVALGWKLVGN